MEAKEYAGTEAAGPGKLGGVALERARCRGLHDDPETQPLNERRSTATLQVHTRQRGPSAVLEFIEIHIGRGVTLTGFLHPAHR